MMMTRKLRQHQQRQPSNDAKNCAPVPPGTRAIPKSLFLKATMLVVFSAFLLAIADLVGPAPRFADAAEEGAKDVDSKLQWSIAAPGRVEPKSGEIRIGATTVGRVAEIPVKARQQLKAGQLMVRLEDDDALARVLSAEAEVEIRQRDRNNAGTTRRAKKRRDAADALAKAESKLFAARRELDHLVSKSTEPAADDESIAKSVAAVDDAHAKVVKTREDLRVIRNDSNTPLLTRTESALALARANRTLAYEAFEKTRIRAPLDGTVLKINIRVGEVVAPSPAQSVVLFGDVSSLRVRAEVDERDVANVTIGQNVTIRSDAFEGQDFGGTVSEVSPALGPGRIGKRGPERPTNANVLEVLVDINSTSPLLPGMQIDVLFGANAPNTATAAAKKEEGE